MTPVKDAGGPDAGGSCCGDDYLDKALEGFAMFALNQGEVCTCPSRALVHEPIYDRVMERAVARFEAMIQGKPPHPASHVWRPQQDACVP